LPEKFLFAQVQALGAFGIKLDLVLHESVHLVRSDVDELEAALGGALFYFGVVVELLS